MTLLNFSILAVHAVVFYAWALFPVLLAGFSRKFAVPVCASPGWSLPRVDLILSAYNEETHIGDRVRNLLALDYPADRWRAFIGVDGSCDRTTAEARAAAAGHPQIEVLDFAENRGKVAVLKDITARISRDADQAEILVFTDANTGFKPEALARLVEPFSDPVVGGVCGKLLFIGSDGGKTEENVYWKIENWLKSRGSDMDSCVGANGAIYAIRSFLFWNSIPSNTIIDDFVIAMKVREQGYRVIYEPRAIAFEDLPEEIGHEWKRRVRIGAGDYQAIGLCRACLAPAFGAFAWTFWSHKVLRWFTPHLMLAGLGLAAAGAVSHRPIPGWITLGLYAALAAAAFSVRGIRYFLTMQAALFVGFVRFCRGNLEGRWQRTARPPSSLPPLG
jgi:cellulose synthase/poly-beta-1,6-N-acetylglucosamine synthase-like glycosyltransferase